MINHNGHLNPRFTYVYMKIHCLQILFYSGRHTSPRYLCTWHLGDIDYHLTNCIRQHLREKMDS